jgi:hypothetical protein
VSSTIWLTGTGEWDQTTSHILQSSVLKLFSVRLLSHIVNHIWTSFRTEVWRPMRVIDFWGVFTSGQQLRVHKHVPSVGSTPEPNLGGGCVRRIRDYSLDDGTYKKNRSSCNTLYPGDTQFQSEQGHRLFQQRFVCFSSISPGKSRVETSHNRLLHIHFKFTDVNTKVHLSKYL